MNSVRGGADAQGISNITRHFEGVEVPNQYYDIILIAQNEVTYLNNVLEKDLAIVEDATPFLQLNPMMIIVSSGIKLALSQ